MVLRSSWVAVAVSVRRWLRGEQRWRGWEHGRGGRSGVDRGGLPPVRPARSRWPVPGLSAARRICRHQRHGDRLPGRVAGREAATKPAVRRGPPPSRPAGRPGTLRQLVRDRGGELAEVMRERRTQTNEAARCACLLPALAALPQPLALLEVGASAGLTLLPDLYSYDYDGRRVTGRDPRAPTITCHLPPATCRVRYRCRGRPPPSSGARRHRPQPARRHRRRRPELAAEPDPAR